MGKKRKVKRNKEDEPPHKKQKISNHSNVNKLCSNELMVYIWIHLKVNKILNKLFLKLVGMVKWNYSCGV